MDQGKRNAVKVLSGAALAALAAGLFATVTVGSAVAAGESKEGMVHCTGANACKGKGECKGASNACKGENACKGQGFVSMTAEECAKKGGMVDKGMGKGM